MNKKIKSDDLDHRYRVPKNRKIYDNCMVYSPDDILMFRCFYKSLITIIFDIKSYQMIAVCKYTINN
ncbi:MAG: hypothetical protein M0R46_13145 [Candidatus Muirbacterium halophilum]|nr:hypothetical protein [Candidatus Muirbacterium halophilum]